jgi:hypothetical protein
MVTLLVTPHVTAGRKRRVTFSRSSMPSDMSLNQHLPASDCPSISVREAPVSIIKPFGEMQRSSMALQPAGDASRRLFPDAGLSLLLHGNEQVNAHQAGCWRRGNACPHSPAPARQRTHHRSWR